MIIFITQLNIFRTRLWVTHQQPRFPSFENNSVDLLCPTALQLWSNVKATDAPI